jgi:DNA-directed RNA polymerase specialized sigma24 family protein
MPAPAPPDPDDEQDYDYLQRCLAELPPEDRQLIEAYYQHDKHEKIEHRKRLAEELGMGMNALRIRACRIRTNILERVEKLRAAEAMKQNRPKGHYE